MHRLLRNFTITFFALPSLDIPFKGTLQILVPPLFHHKASSTIFLLWKRATPYRILSFSWLVACKRCLVLRLYWISFLSWSFIWVMNIFLLFKDKISKEAADILRNISSDKESIRKHCTILREKCLKKMKRLLHEVCY